MEYLFGFLLLLGVLIFIHEFGHFIIAKACGVRVETFSIGMGKKFLRFTRGDTEYALSLLPIGGYVKLLGQDPREEVPPELESVSFRHKPLWKRAAVVLAGPAFNALLAIAVFIGLYSVGVPTQAPTLTRVLPESPAAQAGFQSGDQIVAVEASAGRLTRIRELTELEHLVGESTGHSLVFHVARPAPDAQQPTASLTLSFTPTLGWERDTTTGVPKERGTLPGVEYFEAGPILQIDPDSWASARDLPGFLWVSEMSYSDGAVVHSFPVESFRQLQELWMQAAERLRGLEQGRLTLKGHPIVPSDTNPPSEIPETFQLAWNSTRQAPPATLEKAGLHSAELSLVEVKEDSPAQKLGLQPGDRLVTLNGSKIYSFQSFRNRLQDEASGGASLTLGWIRSGKLMEKTITPELVSTEDPYTEAKKQQFQIGGKFLPIQAPPPKTVLKGDSLTDTLQLGFTKTAALTRSMLESFYMLATGQISPKTLGGPILIGKIAGESFKAGPIHFFKMMAFISMNLCILNLLPIPVLDGGHLVLYCIEAVRRRPLSLKVVEAWTTAGFFVLMGLIAVVFFNDLNRLGLFKIFKS